MDEIIEAYFKAYCPSGSMCFYTDNVPAEMMLSEVDDVGCYEWKLLQGTISVQEYKEVEKEFNTILPDNFIQWHKRYFFDNIDCLLVNLGASYPSKPLEELVLGFSSSFNKKLISFGLVPFADERNGIGPLVFDTRNARGRKDFPIRIYDVNFDNGKNGTGEIIFSSFEKMLECLTHFLNSNQELESIQGFYDIDPTGAGSSGKAYWERWINLYI